MANVLFKRVEDSTQLDNMPVVDGSFYVTGDGKSFIDYNGERLPVGGTPDTEMSDRSRNTVENNVIKQYVDNSIIPRKILWTNPSPLTPFEPKSITLSSDDYDVLEIYYYDWTTSKRMKSVKALKGEKILIDASFYSGTDYYVASREMTYNSNTSYSVGNCVSLYGTTTTAIVNPINFVCVPVKILGYKTGLFE